MTDAVYKYELVTYPGVSAVWMPRGAQLLSVGGVDYPVLWAKVDLNSAPDEERRIVIRYTGQPFTGEEGRFIGTINLLEGTLVLHVFEHRSDS